MQFLDTEFVSAANKPVPRELRGTALISYRAKAAQPLIDACLRTGIFPGDDWKCTSSKDLDDYHMARGIEWLCDPETAYVLNEYVTYLRSYVLWAETYPDNVRLRSGICAFVDACVDASSSECMAYSPYHVWTLLRWLRLVGDVADVLPGPTEKRQRVATTLIGKLTHIIQCIESRCQHVHE